MEFIIMYWQKKYKGTHQMDRGYMVVFCGMDCSPEEMRRFKWVIFDTTYVLKRKIFLDLEQNDIFLAESFDEDEFEKLVEKKVRAIYNYFDANGIGKELETTGIDSIGEYEKIISMCGIKLN